MQTTITLENPSNELLQAFRQLAKLANTGLKITKNEPKSPKKTGAKAPNEATLKAAKACGQGHSKAYENFGDFWDEVQKELSDEARP